VTDRPADDDAPRARLILARHGETEWSRSGQHTGRTDIPLTERGRAQAIALGRRLAAFDPVLVSSSPRSRAITTAELAGFAGRIEIDEDLAEWDYGQLEGRLTSDIRKQFPGWTIWSGPVPGGETIDAVAARADRVLARCRAQDGDVILFAHGHFLRVLGARWVEEPPTFGARLALDTATISVLGWEREAAAIERWNEGAEADG
jgi:broad specificity phosphatase PhoE